MNIAHHAPKPPGRRPAGSDTAAVILDAARQLFSEKGFDRTTIRAVAATAGVDPALVAHYYKSKQQLFLSAMLPLFEAPRLLPQVLAGDPADRGARLAALLSQVLDDPATTQLFMGVIRASTSEAQAAGHLRGFVEHNFIGPLSEVIPRTNAELLASLIGAQVVGLFMAKYVIQLGPLQGVASTQLAEGLAPILQTYFDPPANLPPADPTS